MSPPPSSSRNATLLGCVAVVLWGTTIPVSRHLTEQLGTFTAAAAIFLAAGLLGSMPLLSAERRRSVRQLPRTYLLVCGALMVIYTLLLYSALGYAPSRASVVGVIIANYLWPGLTLLFSIPILGHRAHPVALGAGLLAATGGVVLAVTGADMPADLRAASPQVLPAVAAALAAVCWALYSNLARRWAPDAKATGVPLFLLGTGLCLAMVRGFVRETSQFSAMAILELAFLVLFPTLLAYVLWDHAFRRGNPTLLAALSYFIPVLSMLTGSWVLRLAIRPLQWLACILVIAGSLLCRRAVRPSPADPHRTSDMAGAST